MLMLAFAMSIDLVGLTPTAAAEDCSIDCAGCEVAAGPNRFVGECFVGGTEVGADSCLIMYDMCGSPTAYCHFSVGHGSPVPECEEYTQPVSECVDYWHGPDRGVCVDSSRPDCKLWHYEAGRQLCLVAIPQV